MPMITLCMVIPLELYLLFVCIIFLDLIEVCISFISFFYFFNKF